MKCPMAKQEETFCSGGACPFKKKNDVLPAESSSCPNSDPNFNKIIGERTPEERSNLFVVCVLVRTLLYGGVYVYRDAPWMPYVVGILSGLSALQLSRPTKNKQWWSKKFQLFMAILVMISAIAVKIYGVDSRSMAVLLFISLLGGIYQRTQTTLC